MAKVVLLVGEPYSGKTTFGAEMARKLGYAHVSIGELVRQRFDDGRIIGVRELREMIRGIVGARPTIIDNPIKSLDQAAILNEFDPTSTEVWFLERKIDLDLSSRKRPDDAALEEKIALFKAEMPPVYEALRSAFPCRRFLNTDAGFKEEPL